MKVLAIVGPTAAGKSALAMALARTMGGEIVSIDSRQAYRHIDIGTAKPVAADRALIPHHCVDVIELFEKIDAERFARMARAAVRGITERGRLPIATGGSGLYLRALLDGFFEIDLGDADRVDFSRSVGRTSARELHERLRRADPESAARIHPNDRYRIVRALEVADLSGVPLSEHIRRQRDRGSPERIDRCIVGLTMPRERLYDAINRRTREMLRGGWIEEVARLLEGGADPSWPGLKSLGYPEVIALVRGKLALEDVVERVSRQTRRYAKRQLTWFRKTGAVRWFDSSRPGLAARVLDWLGRNAAWTSSS